jgi:recombination protein RecT
MKNENQVVKEQQIQPAIIQKEIAEEVLSKVKAFQEAKELIIPSDYIPENALKSAMLILSELKDRNGKQVLEVCSKKSIANSLLKMIVEGLSPMKNQCYFIIYGTELTCSRSYQGSMALAKRIGNVKDFVSNLIYQNDVFEFGIDLETGRRKILKHETKLENAKNESISGAYCHIIYEDGTIDVEIMTIEDIRKAWNQGATKGNSPAHQNFTGEMAKKTIISRACKKPINSSSDAFLLFEKE